MSVQAVPEGFSTLTPHLVIKNAAQAIEFYKKAFGAIELHRMPMPDGRIMHAAIKIGNSILMLCDEMPDFGALGPDSIGGSSVWLHLYFEDADAVMAQAVTAGAEVKMPLENTFWGDRYGKVQDPFGHQWAIASHVEDVTPEETDARFKKLMTDGGGGC